MNVLFLDDDPKRHKTFRSEVPCCQWVKNVEECIKAFEKADEPWDVVFLDHDLSGPFDHYIDTNRKDCGMEVVRWIEANQPPIKKIVVHTHNGPAGNEMLERLSRLYDDVEYIFFYQLVSEATELVYGPS